MEFIMSDTFTNARNIASSNLTRLNHIRNNYSEEKAFKQRYPNLHKVLMHGRKIKVIDVLIDMNKYVLSKDGYMAGSYEDGALRALFTVSYNYIKGDTYNGMPVIVNRKTGKRRVYVPFDDEPDENEKYEENPFRVSGKSSYKYTIALMAIGLLNHSPYTNDGYELPNAMKTAIRQTPHNKKLPNFYWLSDFENTEVLEAAEEKAAKWNADGKWSGNLHQTMVNVYGYNEGNKPYAKKYKEKSEKGEQIGAAQETLEEALMQLMEEQGYCYPEQVPIKAIENAGESMVEKIEGGYQSIWNSYQGVACHKLNLTKPKPPKKIEMQRFNLKSHRWIIVPIETNREGADT